MTKNQFRAFCKLQGWLATYSGKGNAFYVSTGKADMSPDDIEVAVAQHFGILPDFKLFVA